MMLSGRMTTPIAQVPHLRLVSARQSRMVVRVAETMAPAAPVKAAPVKFVEPTLNPDTPSPIFGGSTGGLLRKAQVRRLQLFLIHVCGRVVVTNAHTPLSREAQL